MTRTYDADGQPIYCDGSGAAPEHIHRYPPVAGHGACGVCHGTWQLTKKGVLRKHFAELEGK